MRRIGGVIRYALMASDMSDSDHAMSGYAALTRPTKLGCYPHEFDSSGVQKFCARYKMDDRLLVRLLTFKTEEPEKFLRQATIRHALVFILSQSDMHEQADTLTY